MKRLLMGLQKHKNQHKNKYQRAVLKMILKCQDTLGKFAAAMDAVLICESDQVSRDIPPWMQSSLAKAERVETDFPRELLSRPRKSVSVVETEFHGVRLFRST
jgi:hypothetical protein